MKKKTEQQLLINILKGDVIHDVGATMQRQQAFIDRIQSDYQKLTRHSAEMKPTEAYLNTQLEKMNTMLAFIDDAVTTATGKSYRTHYSESALHDFNIQLVISPKKKKKK